MRESGLSVVGGGHFPTLAFCLRSPLDNAPPMPVFRSALVVFLMSSLQASAFQYAYTVRWPQPTSHTLHIEVTVPTEGRDFTHFRMPNWRPGRYHLQDYAAGVSHVSAEADGTPLAAVKQDAHTWRVRHGGQAKTVTFRYRWFANTLDAGSSVLRDDLVYLNPVNFLVHVPAFEDAPCTIAFPDRENTWKVATALEADEAKNTYFTGSYHDLVDAPTLFAPAITTLDFQVDKVPFYLHFIGNFKANKADQKELLKAVEAVVREQAAVFGKLPDDLNRYHFLYLLVPYRLRHAVEHKFCSMYTLPENVTESWEALRTGLMGITSHEFWHTWNVKRLRPAALTPYNYHGPVYTRLHWFTEGVTDYYAYLTLTRAGIWSEDEFYRYLERVVGYLHNSVAEQVVSPEQASFDSWLGISPYAAPHHGTSFYTQGTRVAVLLDLALRTRTDGKTGLDDVFQYLYNTYYENGAGLPEDGVQKACETLTQRNWDDFFATYVRGTGPHDYAEILDAAGLELTTTPRPELPVWRYVGIGELAVDDAGLGVVGSVVWGSSAHAAGLDADDLLLNVNGKRFTDSANPWLAEEIPDLGTLYTVELLRRGRTLKVEVPYTGSFAPTVVQLTPVAGSPPSALEGWLKKRG